MTRHLRPDRGRRLDARLEHAGLIGELEFDAPPPGGIEPAAQLGPAAPRRHGAVVLAQRGIAQHGGVKGTHHRRAVVVEVFDQLHFRGKAEAVEQRQRCGAQELREPCVEGTDLDRPAGAQDPPIQRTERRCLRFRLRGRDAALDQGRDPLGVRRTRRRVRGQPFAQAQSHFAGGGTRERNGEDLVRRSALEQRAQHARHEDPGLARAGAGLDRAAARRVAGDRVERLAARRRSVDEECRRGHPPDASGCAGSFASGVQ